MTCPICHRPALSRERIGKHLVYTHEAHEPVTGPAKWIVCVDMKSAQEELV